MFLGPELRAQPPHFDYTAFALPENVNLTFRLSPHAHANDLPTSPELSAEFKAADAVIVEGVSSRNDLIKTLGKIARGDAKEYQRARTFAAEADQINYSNWVLGFYTALYGSRVPITSIDVDVRHRAIREFMQADERHVEAYASAASDADILLAKKRYEPVLAAVKKRDQQILENLEPRIDELTSHHRNLATKRGSQPIDIAVYFGTMHRSLFDAVTTKNIIDPTQGFTAQLHASSTETLSEALYAHYLRDLPVPDTIYLANIKLSIMQGYLLTYGLVEADMPTLEREAYVLDLIGDKDLGEVREIGESMSRGKTARLWKP